MANFSKHRSAVSRRWHISQSTNCAAIGGSPRTELRPSCMTSSLSGFRLEAGVDRPADTAWPGWGFAARPHAQGELDRVHKLKNKIRIPVPQRLHFTASRGQDKRVSEARVKQPGPGAAGRVCSADGFNFLQGKCGISNDESCRGHDYRIIAEKNRPWHSATIAQDHSSCTLSWSMTCRPAHDATCSKLPPPRYSPLVRSRAVPCPHFDRTKASIVADPMLRCAPLTGFQRFVERMQRLHEQFQFLSRLRQLDVV